MTQSKQKGGIQKRGLKFLVRVSVPDPSLGIDIKTGTYKKKIVRLGSFDSMAEAVKARDRARYESDQGSLFVNTGLTVEEFFRRWFVAHSLKVKASTARRYQVIFSLTQRRRKTRTTTFKRYGRNGQDLFENGT